MSPPQKISEALQSVAVHLVPGAGRGTERFVIVGLEKGDPDEWQFLEYDKKPNPQGGSNGRQSTGSYRRIEPPERLPPRHWRLKLYRLIGRP